MDLLRVEATMLRALLPDLVLREGMKVVASVAERAGQKGIIVLAGTPLAAQLPDDVQAGDVLRLIVTDTSSERIVLRIADAQQAPQAPPVVVALPLPDGMQARIAVAERDESAGSRAGGDDEHVVRLTYASARLGTLDLHLALTAGGELVRVDIRARAGAPYELAERNAAELQEAIAAATCKAAQVLVSPRHDPLDVYA
jgi:hypothetical protein